LYITDPVTLPALEVKVNVAASIVFGFIALLNVAVIRALLGQTPGETSGGVTEVTIGAVNWGFPKLILSASPQPAARRAIRIAMVQELLSFSLRIFLSSSFRLVRVPFSIKRLLHVRVIEFSTPRAGADIHPVLECVAICGGLIFARAVQATARRFVCGNFSMRLQ
jgi:hypothetical protein